MALEDEGVGVGVVGVIAAEFLAEEAFDLDDLGGEAVGGEEFFDLVHAEEVPMVFIHGAEEVVGDFVYLEEVGADGAAGDAAEFLDGTLEAGKGKVFEEVVDEREFEGAVGRGEFEGIADVEMGTREKCAGVLDVGGAEVEASVVEEAREAVGMEETVVVGGAAGGFEDGEVRGGWSFGGEGLAPESFEGVEWIGGIEAPHPIGWREGDGLLPNLLTCGLRGRPPHLQKVFDVVRNFERAKRERETGESFENEARDLKALGIVCAELKGVEDGAEFFGVAVHRESREPVHDSGETAFVGHQRGKFLPENGVNQKMAGENTLEVDARVFDAGDEIITEPG